MIKKGSFIPIWDALFANSKVSPKLELEFANTIYQAIKGMLSKHIKNVALRSAHPDKSFRHKGWG